MRVQWLYLALAAGILFFIVLSSWLNSSKKEPTNQTVSSSQVATGNLAYPTIQVGELFYIAGDSNELVVRKLGQDGERRIPVGRQLILGLEIAPRGQEALVLAGDDQGGWSTLDLQTGQLQQLHPHVYAPTWSPKGDRIAYLFADENLSDLRLTVSDPDGNNWNTVFALPQVQFPFERLWWSPLESYIVGLDTAASPPRYVRMLLSSKRIETLAEGSGDLRWSSSGKLALLDGPQVGQVNIANIETGKVTPLGATTSVRQLTWETEETLVGLVTDGNGETRLSRIKLTDKSVETINDTPFSAETDSVIGIHNDQIYLFVQGVITTTQIKK